MSPVTLLLGGQIGVMPTDTVYGLHGLALNQQVVRKIYRLKGRDETKPLIVIISNLSDLTKFGIKLNKKTEQFLKKAWPAPLTVILPCPLKEFEYLHRGSGSIGFRMPDNKFLQDILAKTGPLISTSANLSGSPPAQTVKQAKNYFGRTVDFYIDEGELVSKPSTVIGLQEGKVKILRQGSVRVAIPADFGFIQIDK